MDYTRNYNIYSNIRVYIYANIAFILRKLFKLVRFLRLFVISILYFQQFSKEITKKEKRHNIIVYYITI